MAAVGEAADGRGKFKVSVVAAPEIRFEIIYLRKIVDSETGASVHITVLEPQARG